MINTLLYKALYCYTKWLMMVKHSWIFATFYDNLCLILIENRKYT